jgi:hypothetical protein
MEGGGERLSAEARIHKSAQFSSNKRTDGLWIDSGETER